MRSPLRSASALFRSRWWAIGFGLAFLAWCLHVAALSMAPLSLVQAVIAGGLAMLAIPARRWFGIAVCRREMAGIGLCAAGLGFLALTAGHARSGDRIRPGDDAGLPVRDVDPRWPAHADLEPARANRPELGADGRRRRHAARCLRCLAQGACGARPRAAPEPAQPVDRDRDPRRDRRVPRPRARAADRRAGRRDRRLLGGSDPGGHRGRHRRLRRPDGLRRPGGHRPLPCLRRGGRGGRSAADGPAASRSQHLGPPSLGECDESPRRFWPR